MRLPVTFKQINLEELIYEWGNQTFPGHPSMQRENNDIEIKNAKALNLTPPAPETYYYMYHTTWFGLVIDTLITVHDCTQVFKA